MILVDTSVWIDHFRKSHGRLRDLLEEDRVLIHPFVLGELACGNFRNRKEILSLLGALPETRVAEQEEVLHLIESHQLHGLGLGWIDLHLLASTLLTGCMLWTHAKALKETAESFKIAC